MIKFKIPTKSLLVWGNRYGRYQLFRIVVFDSIWFFYEFNVKNDLIPDRALFEKFNFFFLYISIF